MSDRPLDYDYYDQLIKRGRELYWLIRADAKALGMYYQLADIHESKQSMKGALLALGLLEQHLDKQKG